MEEARKKNGTEGGEGEFGCSSRGVRFVYLKKVYLVSIEPEETGYSLCNL